MNKSGRLRRAGPMTVRLTFRLTYLLVGAFAFPSLAAAFQTGQAVPTGTEGGVSAIWIFANLSFTGMWAQDHKSTFWKAVSFVFGLPATLLTLIVVDRGSERAYGIDMPRRPRGSSVGPGS
jgi:hypothetical protein